MDILLPALQTTKSVTPTEWQQIEAEINAFTDVDAAREALNTLVDTYNEYNDSAADVPCREAIVHTLTLLLKEASVPQHHKTSSSSPQWQLNSEDCLLLAMFLNDLSTVVQEGVFRNLCQCVALLYKVSYPFLYAAADATEDETEKENRRSLAQELQALRTALAKRLTSTAAQLHQPRLQLVALDGCFAVLQLHWCELVSTSVATTSTTPPSKEMEEDVRDMLKGLLGPFDVALEGLVKAGSLAPKTSGGKGDASKRGSYVASPLLLGTILYRLEELLWRVTKTAAMTAVCHYLLSELLTVFQKYVTLQQHKQTDSLQPSGAEDGPGRSRDAFRVYGVQRAIQRTLSVALHVQETAGEEGGVSLAALRTGLLAAVNAFGGAVPVTAPTSHLNDQNVEKEVPTWRIADNDDEEEEVEGGSRVRPCAALVQAQEEDAQGAQADVLLEGLEDDAAAYSLLGGKDALLRLSFGVVSPSTLAEMVMYSISQLDYITEDNMQDLHREGLEQMQYEAARRAQREELERQRLVEQQGIEAIPAAKLIEHVKDSTSIQQQGMQLLRRPSARAHLQRCAFRNILQSYEYVQGEAEERLRITQALIARCLVQMPPTLADVALDDVLLRLSGELQQDAAQKEANERNGITGARTLVSKPFSYYQLVLQILFTSFSALAPFEDREENTFLLLADATGAGAGGAVLRSTPHMTIDTENPIAFMQEMDTHVPSYLSGSRKRARLEEVDGEGDALQAEEEGDHFAFLNDTRGRPSAYSHLLCRVLELLLAVYRPYLQTEHLLGSAKLPTYLDDTLVDLLLQAPSLPRYVWHHLYKQLCLSTERDRFTIGTWLLGRLTVHRVVYRDCAFNLLIHLCMSTNEYARRLSIYQVGVLLAQQHSGVSGGGGGVSEQAEKLLLQYAQKQLAVIPVYQPSSSSTTKEEGDMTAETPTTTETTGDAQQQEVVLKAKLNRHLGLFLMLCTRQPRQLFVALLEMYKQCVERQNTAMAHLIPSNKDIYKMTQNIFKRDPTAFVSYVMPSLRRYSKEAAPLVQVMLWALSEKIRAMSGTEGAAGAAALPKVVEAVLGHVKAMYERAEIPVGGGAAGTAVIHDIRFVAPFLSFLTATELRQTYLRSFLYFVQVQLQLQRQYQSQMDQLAMRNSHYVLSAEDLTHFIQQVVREVIVKCPVTFEDQQPRGLSRVELMVYLHRAPQESHAEATTTTTTSTTAVRLPPISATTTKEVVHVCLDLTRSFDTTTIEKLYGPEEMEKAVRKMLHPPPIPSQLMVTILMAAALFVRNRHTDFLRFVVQNVLVPLGRANTWETNPQLWKGVLVFAENYYKVCSNFLVNLPDQVLMEALRERPQLCDSFKEEHGNNATFGHILGNL